MHTFYKIGQPSRWMRLLSLLLLLPLAGRAQTTIAGYNFEPVPATPTAAVNAVGTLYTGSSASGDRPATATFFSQGTQAFGISNGTATVTSSADINASAYTNISVSFRLASFSITSTGNGADAGDIVLLGISTDGGATYSNEVQVQGNSNAYWHYSTGAGTATRAYTGNNTPTVSSPGAGGNRTTDGFSTVSVTGIATTSQLRFRISLLNNSSSERWVMDDILVRGTPIPPPAITSFSPASGPVGTTVTVTGTDFTGATAVTLNGATVSYTVASATSITFTVPAGATSGAIAVTTPSGTATSGTSFNVTASPNPVPTITSLSPNSATAGDPAQTLTVNGTSFIASSVVNFNGTDRATTYVSATQLTIALTAGDQATAGTYNVTVTNPTPGGGTSAASTFTVNPAVVSNPVPTITSLSPNSVPAGTGAFTLTINGTGFLSSSTVTFNGFPVPATYISGSQLSINLPAGAATGTYPVIVTNPAPGGGASAPFNFTVTPAALGDLTVSSGTLASPTPIAGNYNNIFITGTGVAVVVGPLTAATKLEIQQGGILAQSCQQITGTGNFDLQAGGTLIICDALGISPTGVATGAILLAGTRTYSPLANYIYNGNVAQFTGLGLPNTVLAVGVQNLAGVTLSKALSLTQGLQLQSGNLNTGTNAFTLLSTATGTAGVVNAGGVVVGTTTVQRYINSANALGYRHYSAPVSNTTFADLATAGFSPVFNSGYNGSATPGTVTPFPTVFGYNQDRIATVASNFSAFDKGWFSPADASDPMVVGKGYTVNAPNTALVDFVGTLNNGSVPSGTLNRGTDPAAGWHLLGNPYPSPINWSTVAPAQRPGMDAAIYVFESAGQYGGSYRASVNGVGGNSNSPQPIVVASQGYFVRVASGQPSGQVNLDNSNRVTTFGAQPSFGRGTADTRPQVALTLQGASVADAAYVYFQAGATAGKDVEFDATKLNNSHGLNLTSLAGGEALAINGLPALGAATVLVPLNVAAPQAGSYALKADALANLTGTTVTLVDALTSTRTVLTAGTTYAFTLSSSAATGRFALEFRPSGALATTAAQALSAQTQLFPNPASGSFRVQLPLLAGKTTVQATLANALGQTVLSRTLNAAAGQAIDAEFDVRALAVGVYTLRLNVNGTPVVRKVMVE